MSSSSRDGERVQSVRTAWINRLRDEALRMRRPDVSKIAHIGWIIATYADGDGSSAFPASATIAAIAGCSEETVTRCVRVLIATGLVERKRRPNRTAVFQLGRSIGVTNWKEHLALYGETRQAKARRKAKAAEAAELIAAAEEAARSRNPSGDGFRNPSPAGVPEPVPGGVTTEPGTRPRTGSEPDLGRVPEPVPGGGVHVSPTYGRDPDSDHDHAEPELQPQVGAGAGARDKIDSSPETQRLDDIAGRIVEADQEHEPPQLQALPGGTPQASGTGQRALLLPVASTLRVTEAERAELRAAGAADIHRVIAAIEEQGEAAALALYGGRLVTGAHNERARIARIHTGT